jgi:hypothetical protein
MAILEPTKKVNTLDMMKKIHPQENRISTLDIMKKIKEELEKPK